MEKSIKDLEEIISIVKADPVQASNTMRLGVLIERYYINIFKYITVEHQSLDISNLLELYEIALQPSTSSHIPTSAPTEEDLFLWYVVLQDLFSQESLKDSIRRFVTSKFDCRKCTFDCAIQSEMTSTLVYIDSQAVDESPQNTLKESNNKGEQSQIAKQKLNILSTRAAPKTIAINYLYDLERIRLLHAVSELRYYIIKRTRWSS
jgi:hypothetical protein